MASTESLGDYFIGLPYPLKQPYDIDQSGEVSVNSGGEVPKKDIPIIKDPLPIRRR